MTSQLLHRRDVLACQYHSWHERFRDVAIRSVLVPLDEDMVAYLHADSVFLPDDATVAQPVANTENDMDGWDAADGAAQTRGDGSSDDENAARLPATLDAWRARVDEIIGEQLEGEAFPKLNWSAPLDADWIAPNSTMLCRNADEVLLLLKSSDFVGHDLSHAFDDCEDDGPAAPEEHVLVLKQFYTGWKRAYEFRCFVRDGVLVAISQRHADQFFAGLAAETERIRDAIVDFFNEVVQERGGPATHYVMDVYLIAPRLTCRVVDFNPWAYKTKPALFTWDELRHETLTDEEDDPMIRVHEHDVGIQRSDKVFNRVPYEAVDLQNAGAIEKFAAMMRDGKVDQSDSSSEEEEEEEENAQ